MAAPEPGNPFRRVRLYVSTFDAMHPPAVRTFLHATRHRHPVWMQGWGQSETGPLTFRFLTRRALAADPASAIRPPATWAARCRCRTRLQRRRPARPCVPSLAGTRGLVLPDRGTVPGLRGGAGALGGKSAGGWWNTGDIGIRTRTGRLLLP